MITVRNYQSSDYDQVAALYQDSSLYGGQFDEAKDSQEKLEKIITRDPEAILVAQSEGKIIGTLSLIEDGRVAWLFRFAVQAGEHHDECAQMLYQRAVEIFKERGHSQTIVYAPVGDQGFEKRYKNLLGLEKGNDYTCYWKNI